MSAQQQLITIEQISEENAPAIYVAGGLKQFIDLVKGEIEGEVPDLTTRKAANASPAWPPRSASPRPLSRSRVATICAA